MSHCECLTIIKDLQSFGIYLRFQKSSQFGICHYLILDVFLIPVGVGLLGFE